jgi:hypothetical protein
LGDEAIHETPPRDAAGKSGVVLDTFRRRGEASWSFAIEQYHLESLPMPLNGGGNARRSGANYGELTA